MNHPRRWAAAVLLTLVLPLFLPVRAGAMGTSGATTRIGLTLPGMTHRTIDVDAATLFRTLMSDFFFQDDGTLYVQTGDIPAMWLRDSSAQTLPYVRFSTAYPQLAVIANGVIQRNAKNILTSPYANAFTAGYQLWEEKWEVDSLAYTLSLDSVYWRTTADRGMFTQRLHWAFEHIVTTYECEQQHDACSGYRSRFLDNHGKGADHAYTGMIWSAFRPSDDPVRYPYNIPQQLFAAYELEQLAHLALVGYNDVRLAERARTLAAAVRLGVEQYGEVYDFRHGWMFAYEVDGLGQSVLMDDANLPNLLALPFMNLVQRDDPLYVNSRSFSLSSDNPYWYRGRYGDGLGSPHTRTGWVWPLGIISEAMTSLTPDDLADRLAELRTLDGRRGLFYESVDPDRPWHYTRGDFGWANALYAELIFRSVAWLEPPPDQRRLIPDPLAAKYETPKITTPTQAWDAAGTIYTALRQIVSGG